VHNLLANNSYSDIFTTNLGWVEGGITSAKTATDHLFSKIFKKNTKPV
jgi:hypothetical protein